MIVSSTKKILAAGVFTLAAFSAASVAAQPAQLPQPLAERTAETDLPLTGPRASMALPQLRLAFDVDPATRQISGEARYTVEARAALNSLAFDLDPRFDVTRVRVGTTDLDPSQFANPDGLLTIALPQPLAAGEQASVFIDWEGAPHVAANAPWDGGFVWSQTSQGEPWIATAVQGEGCDLFWPCIDHSSSRIEMLDTYVTVPEGLVAAGNGALIETRENDGGTTTFHWRARDPSNYGVTLQIAPYQLSEWDYQSRFGNTIPIKFWHLPENEVGARRLIGELSSYLDVYEGLIGPYPFGDEKVGVAETPHLGMEHQTINAYGNRYRQDGSGYDWLLNHEFAHEWFANQLTHADINHMWLHEGIGTWMQPVYLGATQGQDAYDAEMARQRRIIVGRVPLVTREGPRPDYSDDTGWGIDIYAKGAWVMHSLNYLVGEDVLFPALTELTYGTTDPQPGAIRPVSRTTDDFQRLLEERGADVDWFFDTYFYHPELPRLNVTRDGEELVLAWESPSELAFEMPVEVRLGEDLVSVIMEGGRGRLPLSGTDAEPIIDPNRQILKQELPVQALKTTG